MDVRWVSSLSWYFLNFFGLNGLHQMILGGDNGAHAFPHYKPSFPLSVVCHTILTSDRLFLVNIVAASDVARDMVMSPYAGAMQPRTQQPQDFGKIFKAERDNLELAEGLYSWTGKDVETRILQKYGKLSP